MRARFGLGWSSLVLGVFLFSRVGSASDSVPKVDLDQGVAITGNGRAVFTNPAALPDFRGRLLDVGVYNSWDFGLVGQFSSSLAENIGLGVGLQRFNSENIFTPGLGFSLSKWSFGASSAISPGNYAFQQFTVGARWSKGDDFSVGIVVYDVPQVRNVAFGIGIGRTQKFMGELDAFMTFSNSSFDLASAAARLALSYLPSRSVWLSARLVVPVAPTMVFDRRNIELGLHVWLGSKIALYALYQAVEADVLAGIKIKI